MTPFDATSRLKSYGLCYTTVANLSDLYIYNKNSKLAGIEINQDQYNSNITFISASQEFYLPLNYARATNQIPDIMGFQIFANYNDDTAQLDYFFDYYNPNFGWINLRSGIINSEPIEINEEETGFAQNWYTIRFNPVEINSNWLSYKFRIRINQHAGTSGFTTFYYQSPSPSNKLNLYQFDGITPMVSGATSALAFRLLTLSADSGIDFLGNEYRSYVHKTTSNNINQRDDSYWLSKPNPSKFAVENLYFDISNQGYPTSIDSVLIDPITPNVYFNVYYSNDSAPGYDDASWENLMWTRIPKVFKATKKDVYVFPENISAKYIKLEFSHLQAKYYAPGAFQKPILYKKHPQWVFDYFIANYESQNNKTYDPFIQGQITVDYDILDLAFNYYKGDIIQTSNGPIELTNQTVNQDTILNLLTNHSEGANLSSFDTNTLSQIKTAFSRFTIHPSANTNAKTVIDTLSTQVANSTISASMVNGKAAAVRNYPIENINRAIADTTKVSTIDREPLILEKQFPVMFFYVTCRHGYREAWAKFEDDKAYFAGIKNVIFQRENHSIENNSGLYAYGTGEFDLNVEHNDFVLDNNSWKSR